MCVQAGALPLSAAETAEMPDMYDADEYDLAGFTTGVVEKSCIIDGSDIRKTMSLLGFPPQVCIPAVSHWSARRSSKTADCPAIPYSPSLGAGSSAISF